MRSDSEHSRPKESSSPARRTLAIRAAGVLGTLAVMAVAADALSALRDKPATQVPAASDSGELQPSPSARPSFAIRARAIYPVTAEQPGPIEDAVLVVREGLIAAVGNGVAIPADLPLIELRDAVICPGFVSAAGALGGSHEGEVTVSGAYRAIDNYDVYGDDRPLLARGTTATHLSPGGHRLVSGRGAIVKLAGAPAERVLVAESDLVVNLGVYNPPDVVDVPFVASSDVAIRPSQPQRPESRMGQFLELDQRIAQVDAVLQTARLTREEAFDWHSLLFAKAWRERKLVRIQVRRTADIEGALAFVKRHAVPAYIVGLGESAPLADALVAGGLPLVVRVEHTYRFPNRNLGPNPEVYDPPISMTGALGRAGLRFALAGSEGDAAEDLQMIGALAVRGGLSRDAALAAITRIPAEILGVGDRIGSLSPGKDADFVVLSGRPLEISSHVLQTYVNGQLAFEAPRSDALVVKAGRLWVGDGSVLEDGALLVENGKITAVGRRVPHPPFARVIDAGPGGFVTPGFIDAHGHLGLEGDQAAAGADIALHRLFAVAGREFARVARAGVTTVLVSAYKTASNGAQVTAVKTSGAGRDQLIAREVAGLKYSMDDRDPLTGIDPFRSALEAGRKYADAWKKYDEDLKKWEEDRKKGTATGQQAASETVVEARKADPITGTWEFTISGGPLPESVSGTMLLRLTGDQIEGRLSVPQADDQAEVSGKLEGDRVVLEIEQDTPLGKPRIETRLDREDHMAGKVKLGGQFEIDFDATRTSKEPVEFKVTRRRKKRADGKPEPPKVEPALEPYRALLAGKIPAVVQVQTAAQASSVIRLFVDEFKLSLVMLDAEGVASLSAQLDERKDHVGVVVGPQILRQRDRVAYNPAADLARRGVRVALQSDAEDGSRSLPLMGLFAVQQGLGGDAALRAMTIDAAKLYKIEDRVGSLEVGKDADVLIHTGHPFDADSRLERIIINGREVVAEDELR